MLLRPVEFTHAKPKWLLNGLPKSGLHLISLMIAPLANPPKTDMWVRPDWWGDLFNVWTSVFREGKYLREMFYRMAALRPGQYVRAHAAYREDIHNFVDLCGVSHVFIYRDLRDVAVSHAHHVISDNPEQDHTSKSTYRLMGDFDEVLMSVIKGIGGFDGVLKRWEQFAPWLECERVHKVKFEDAIEDREKVARDILAYGVNRIQDAFDLDWTIHPKKFEAGVQEMVKTSYRTELSQTFRKGETGEWRETFKKKHVKAFKKADKAGWLVKLGYEQSEDWGL